MRYELYDLHIEKPAPIVPRHLSAGGGRARQGQRSSVGAAGQDGLSRCVEWAVASGVTSLAIIFLHSYSNPENEIAAANIVRERFPDLFVTTSHEVVPEIRE